MKKVSLFAKIVYYLFTFSLGIILAIFLPFVYLYDGEALNIIQDALDAGSYSQAMGLVGGYYNTESVLNAQFEGGGKIVLFESATLYDEVYGEGEEAVSEFKMHKSYSGFVYGLGDNYSAGALLGNQTKLLINTTEGQKEFEILNCDTNADGILDNISSLLTNNFFFLELAEEDINALGVKDILSLSLVKSDGSVYGTVQTTNETFNLENLFKTQFFGDDESFIEKNNQLADYKVLNKEDADYEQKLQGLSVELGTLNNELLTNEKYAKSSTEIAKSRADKRASRTIIVYFVCVYVIGDFILGTKYILKFIKWFGVKVLKIKPKQVELDKTLFGSDYYSQVEFKLETVGLKPEDEVTLTYKNETEEVTFTLNYVNGYTQTQRMKAGVYTLQPAHLHEKYDVELIPETVVAEGYKKAITAKIIRREEERA